VADEPLTPRGISTLDPNGRLVNFETAGVDRTGTDPKTIGYFVRSEPHPKAENSEPYMSTKCEEAMVMIIKTATGWPLQLRA
jgi:hypothetical protein